MAPTLKPVVTTSPTKQPTVSLFSPTPPTTSDVTVPEPPTAPTPEELYYDEWWRDLPPEIQAGYAALGYTEAMWDGAIEPETNDMEWAQLTEEQRQAALSIGYTEDMWCETIQPTAGPTTARPTSATPANATFAGIIGGANDDGTTNGTTNDNDNDGSTGATDPDGNKEATTVDPGLYEDYDWAELPPEAMEAAGKLGYDQKLWDMDGLAWSENAFWSELTPEQQEAAALLGYDQVSWDGTDLTQEGDDYVSYDDDYVFQVNGLDDVWVSRYQILYFWAALSFVFVGLLDLIRERHVFHLMMILAGVFGVASSVYVEEDIHLSNILNCVSVHLFLLEAVTLIGEHKRSSVSAGAAKWMKVSVLLGDLEFAGGALIDVIISYFYLFDEAADWDVALAISGIFAATLWLHCSLIYMGAFFYYPEAKSVKGG